MIHIIANPYAQSGAIRHVIDELTAELTASSLPYILHLTEYAGHAGILASGLELTPSDHLVILGGDGSIDETINGLTLPCPCPLHLLPAGTGNDFARGLHIHRDMQALVRSLSHTEAPCHILDLGHVSYQLPNSPAFERNFAVSCGLGMDAAVCVVLRNSPIKTLCNRIHAGKLAYIIHGIQVLCTTSAKKRTRMTLVLDGNTTLHFNQTAFLSCHNTPYEGGGFPFAPDASPEDGLLSACIVTVPNRLLLVPVLLASLAGGKHPLFHSYVHTFRCHTLQIQSDQPLPFHTDGEVNGELQELTIQVLPKVLPLIPQ